MKVEFRAKAFILNLPLMAWIVFCQLKLLTWVWSFPSEPFPESSMVSGLVPWAFWNSWEKWNFLCITHYVQFSPHLGSPASWSSYKMQNTPCINRSFKNSGKVWSLGSLATIIPSKKWGTCHGPVGFTHN